MSVEATHEQRFPLGGRVRSALMRYGSAIQSNRLGHSPAGSTAGSDGERVSSYPAGVHDLFERVRVAADRLYSSPQAWGACLGLLFLAALIVRLAGFTGLIGSDDLWYARYAERIAGGIFPTQTNQYVGRVGVTVTVAALYRLFGVSEWTTVLAPLLAASASVPLLAMIGARLYGPLAGIIAALLLCTSPIHIRFATILVPEPLMEFWILVAIWCYLEAARRASRVLGVVTGLLIGVAYLTKEPAAFVAPAVAAAALFTGRRWLAVAITIGALSVPVAEAATYAVTLHAPLRRFDSATVGVPPPSSRLVQRLGREATYRTYVVHRLFVSYPRRMLWPTMDFGLHYPAALALAAVGLFVLRQHRLFLMLWTVVPWVYLNFGTANFRHFVPLFAAERYVSVTLPPLFVLTAGVLTAQHAARFPRVRTALVGVLLLVCAVGVTCAVITRGTGFRTPEMAMLRSMVTRSMAARRVPCHAEGDRGHVVVFGNDRVDMWTDALRVFEASRSTRNATSVVAVTKDEFGLPMLQSGDCMSAAADPSDGPAAVAR